MENKKFEILDKAEILKQIVECVSENAAGEDEENLLQNFLPLRSYSKLADSKTFLITGGRGAGKSELFRILTSCDGLTHILSETDKKRYTDLKKSEFIVGYIAQGNHSKNFPTQNIASKWIKEKKSEEVASFWCGLLCSVLIKRFADNEEIINIAKAHLGEELYITFLEKSSQISSWFELVYAKEEECESFLSKIDDWLGTQKICIFLTYDELDRICGNYKDLFAFIRNLLSFWFLHNNRFTNIKAKIFLRSDLYNAKALQFVDSSKIRSYHLELKWDTLSLYRMLVKRMANSGSDILLKYLQDVPNLVSLNKVNELGYMPGDTEEAFYLLIEKMIGKYMGKTPKRGYSYTWVPNHIQDANGELAPRPFLKCFSFAAEEMLAHEEYLEENKLLSPTRLQGALVKVSKDRVEELTLEEYQWLENLIDRLYDKAMLMERKEFLGYLKPGLWPEDKREELPGKTSEEILEVLLAMGIIMETSDNRINVPEIYLHGFGLKRKGGIKRPK